MRVHPWLPGLLLLARLVTAPPAAAVAPPVYTVLFTHIEDNTPAGALGTLQSRNNYLLYRGRLIDMATLAQSTGVSWSLQPDWKFLRAALLYEDAALMATTNNKNLLRYLREDRGTIIDPHSHENGGYNYADVAHLLDSLGAGSSTVIGGHIWDPSLPQFAEWDRFRTPVAGQMYPWASWRGDILMGSGTPNHVNDPIVSGVWRPQDRDHYFVHDPAANIVAIGQFRGAVSDVAELRALYSTGVVSPLCLLTNSIHIKPATITAPGGLTTIADSVLAPLLALRNAGDVVLTDFTALVAAWQANFGGVGCLYDAEAPSAAIEVRPPLAPAVRLGHAAPNPCGARTMIEYSVAREARIRLDIFDLQGRPVSRLVDATQRVGRYAVAFESGGRPAGTYVCRLRAETVPEFDVVIQSRKLVVSR